MQNVTGFPSQCLYCFTSSKSFYDSITGVNVFTYGEKSINTSHGFPTGSTVTFITCVKVCDDSVLKILKRRDV